MRKGVAIMAVAVLTVGTSAALANVIDPSTDKDAAKLRADIGKQVAKYTFCLVKTATKCEKKGSTSAVECNLATGMTTIADPKVQQKFAEGIAKCDDKMLLTKKSSDPVLDYIEIGCPGDCDAMADGVQQCADIPAFEAFVEGASASSPKGQLGLLTVGIDIACGMDTMVAQTDQARIDCVADQAKLLTKYAQAAFKCQAKCENDFKDKKGNGGPSNGSECLAGDMSAAQNFTDCVNKALDKISPKLSPSVVPLIAVLNAVVNKATVGLYDRFDPTSLDASASPCGTCGNNTREGAEECDGTDDALCMGSCNSDCTCP